MAISIQSDGNSRFTDLCDEPIDHILPPIRGYQREPLVSLSEALKPISGIFNEIMDNVSVALHNCQYPAQGLTQDESAAIHLYTMEFDRGPNLYLPLNQLLRSENRKKLRPWFSFLKLFLTGLHKLPSESKIVYRAVVDVDLSSKYKTGITFPWWGVSSCTTDINVLESDPFLDEHIQRTQFLIECINGKSVAAHSYFGNTENEIVLMPGSYFEVISQLNPAPGRHIIRLKEIMPPVTFVESPFSTGMDSLPEIEALDFIYQRLAKKVSKKVSFKVSSKGTSSTSVSVEQSLASSSQHNNQPIVYIIDLKIPPHELNTDIVRLETYNTSGQLADVILTLDPIIPFCILASERPSDEIVSHENLLRYYYLQMSPKKYAQTDVKVHDRVTTIDSIYHFASELYGDLGQYYRDKAQEALFDHQNRAEAKDLLMKSAECFRMLEYDIKKTLADYESYQ